MATKNFVYRAVVCGVNEAAGQTPLKYAEADARAVFRTFTGALGPTSSNDSALLLGEHASARNVSLVLDALSQMRNDYILFYFSGHGGDEGIALADGILPYQYLHWALQRIHPRATLVILDACHSGIFARYGIEVGGIEESWGDVLARAMPGTRMFFATRPDENSMEGGSVRGGHFTWSLLEALHRGPGCIREREHRWVSDAEAFHHARMYLAARWPGDAQPDSHNLRGDFPMLLSHEATRPVGRGEAEIALLPRGYAAEVTVRVVGRRGVPVNVRSRLLDANWVPVADTTKRLVPAKNAHEETYRIEFPSAALPRAHHHRLEAGHGARLQWLVEIVDPYHGYVLASVDRSVTYRRPNRGWGQYF